MARVLCVLPVLDSGEFEKALKDLATLHPGKPKKAKKGKGRKKDAVNMLLDPQKAMLAQQQAQLRESSAPM